MTTSIEFDAVSNFSDEHATVGEQPISGVISGVQVVQASGGQTAPAAGEPVPVDVGSGAPAKGDGNAQNAQSTAKPAADGNAPAANAPAGNAPAPNTAASNVAHEYHVEAGNVVKLPANVSIDDIKVDGHNLVLVQPDGAEIVIKDGALNVPTFIIGDVEVPRVALIAALEASHVDVAFGADGSISAGGNGSPSSAGGNFSVPPGGIGDGFGLSALLPPTALAFGQPENRELFPSLLKPDSTPSIGTIGEASVNEAGLPPHGGLPAGSGEIADGDSGNNSNTSETTSGTIGFTSRDGVAQVTLGGHVLTSAAQIFTDATGSLTASYSFDAATGTGTINYSYTLNTNTSGDGTSVSFAVGVTDSDGDAAPPGTLVINIIDDAPTAVADTDAVPSGSHASIDGNVITGAGSDGNATGADIQGADGASVTSAYGKDGAGSAQTVTGAGVSIVGEYGTLVLHSDGSYTYTRAAETKGGVDDVFHYTLTDGDGNQSSTTLTISIGNTPPTITDLTPAANGGDVTVNEAALNVGTPGGPGSDPASTAESGAGTFTIASPDGIATLSIDGHAFITNGVFSAGSFTTALGNTLNVTGYNAATGVVSYTYTLNDNEAHAAGQGTNSLFENMTVSLTDQDGQNATGTLSVNIVDDVPTAHADTDSVAANQFSTEGGNVLTAVGTTSPVTGVDVLGADGATVVGVVAGTTAGGEDANVGTVIQGTYGKLTLNADGSYNYTRDAGSQGGHDDVFTYTIKDGDGDLSHTTLTISIGDSTPTDTIPTPGGPTTTVYEAGLPARGGESAGSDAAANSETTSGTIGFTSPDGIQTVSLGGHVLTGAPQTFTDATGSLTASYTYNAATGVGSISYTYTLLDNTAGDNTHASFAVVVTDADGDSAPAGNLVINIVDDVPTAHADTDSVAANQFSTEGGNVLTAVGTTSPVTGVDVLGADGATVVGVVAGTTAGGEDANVGTVIQGTYGKLTLNADGSYNYTRDAGSQGGHDDVFTYTIKDGDGDLSHTTLTISIGDSTPTDTIPTPGGPTTTVYEAGLPARGGESAGSDAAANSETTSGTIGFTSPDGIQTVSLGGHVLTGAPQTFTDATGSLTASYTYNAATGVGSISYTYTLLDNTAGDNTHASFAVVVTDADGDSAPAGNLVINIVDDVPTAHADTDSVAANQFSTEGGNVLTAVGTTSPVTGIDVLGADGATVVGVVAGTTAGGEDANVGTVIQGTYGKLTLNADGSYNYTRDAGSQGGHDDVFTYTIKDGDGDLSHTTLTISIGDSTPTDTIPTPGGPTTTVYEAGLPARGGESAGSDAAANSETTSGTIGFTSPDGIQTVSLGGHVLTGAPQTFTDATGSLTASYTYNAATGVGSISYTYTLLDNTAGDNTHASFAVVVTDADGDSAPAGNLVINIVDDVPTAHADTDSVAANQFSTEGGNVLTAVGTTSPVTGVDVLGADGATVVGVVAGTTAGGEDANVGTVIQGTYGKLTLNADGSYNYTRDAGSQGGHDDVFTYTIKDGDGDLSHTTLTISIGDSTPTDTIPTPGGPTTTVYEAGLPARGGESAGSDAAANSETTSGTIGFTSPDGIQTVSLGGHVLTGAPQTFTDATGSLTASYTYNAATGVGSISYTYTLLDNTAGDNTHASFAVVVTDADGDSAPAGNLVINIVDDVPTAHADTDSVAANQFSTEGGNVLTAVGTTSPVTGIDVLGADGATVVGVVAGTTAGGEDANVGTVIQGTYGKLTLNADGSYNYTRDAGSQGGHDDVFTYTIKDGDGDLSHTTLTISIGDSTPTDTIPTPGGPTTTVYEAGLPARGGESAGSDAAANSETTSGTIGFTSPDGIQTVSLGGHVLTGAPQTFTDATGSLTASYTYNAATGVGSISYTYTLLDNTAGDNTHASFAVVVTDADGDSAPAGNLVINIIDDVPTAHADTNSAQSGQTVTGNVETNDTAGADGIASIAWTGSSGNTVTGSFGTLTFAADGSYSYHANPNASGIEVFTYTITDGDGDTSPATLTITVANGQPQPVAATQTVNEAALDTTTMGSDIGHGTVTGSNPSSTAETVSGTLSLGDPDSPHVTNIQGATSLVVGASAVIVQGTYGLLQIDQNGNYTYTLTKPFDTTPDANNGTNTETGKDVFTYTVTDAYGNTSTSTISINIIDDVPTAVAPDYAVLANGAGNPVTFALDADTLSNNYGADGAGTVHFATSLDGVDSGLTSGGTHIIYDVSADGHTLYGMANNVAVFTVTLDPQIANPTYTVDMNGTIDSLTNIDFSGSGYDFVGGNKDWTGFVPTGDSVSSPINNNSSDLLLTAIGGSVNTSAIAGGVGTGASVGSGETFRVDFVQDLRNQGGSGYQFDQHYNTNGASAVFTATNGSTVQILAYDDHDTNTNLVGETNPADRSLDTITQVIVAYGGETYTFTSTGSHAIGGHSYTVTFNADGTVAVDGVYGTSGAQAVGTEIAVSTATGFNSIEYHYQAGDTFKIGEFGTAVQSTDPVNFNLPIETVDGDGDTAASGIGVTLYGTGLQDHSADTAGVSHVYTSTAALPNIIGSAYDDTLNGDSSGNLLSGGVGADTINGNGGNDTLVGGAGNDTLNGGAGNDLLIGGLGQDTLTGGTGADTFKLDHLELNIKDLITDYNGAEGDKIDLTALFETAPAGNIADYVHYNSGTNTLSVDANGTTGGANFVDVAQLTNAPAAGTINILYDDSNHQQHTATI